jgi:hypothetical protein
MKRSVTMVIVLVALAWAVAGPRADLGEASPARRSRSTTSASARRS